MVQVRQKLVQEDGQVDLAAWLASLFVQLPASEEEQQQLRRACERVRELDEFSRNYLAQASDNRWSRFSSTYFTGLEMAQILAELHLDIPTLVAAVLYRTVREEKLTLQQVEKEFGKVVARLIEGVLRMAAIGSLRQLDDKRVLGLTSAEQINHVRKMLVALIDDVRVALIKIAERTCAIRAVKQADEAKRRRVAREVKDIYAPLAHRLGIGSLKWELEDLSFRYLEPEAYLHIARLLDEKRLDREKYVHDVIGLLEAELNKAGIPAQLKGRVKHIYSIWRKMQEKNIGFSQVYDVRAVRILVNTVHECYAALGVVHGLWRSIPNEFDDYIANPKSNGYRSLHTAVIGPHGKVMEIQIRTHWMHEESEFGVCAHWRYKNQDASNQLPAGQASAADYENKIEWLRQVLEWHEETGGDRELIEELRSDIVHRNVYVFTPEGDVIELPQHATVLDFAYHVHTGVGHRCRGARVNGKVVPLYHVLRNSDQVEILTGKNEVPNRDWLSDSLGYVTTARARSKIHQWFRQQDREQLVLAGTTLLDREFKRLVLADIDRVSLARQLGFASVDDMHAALGASDLALDTVLQGVQQLEGVTSASHQLSFMQLPMPEAVPERQAGLGISGAGNRRIELASCCQPASPVAIGGVIVNSVVLGLPLVVIHRLECENFLQAQADEPENIIRVSWDEHRSKSYRLEAELEIAAYDRTGLLRDITELFDTEGANIVRLVCQTDRAAQTVQIQTTLELQNLQTLSALLKQLNSIPNVYSARRKY